MRYFALGCLLSFFCSPAAVAVELISSPDGVWVRSLLDWEGVERLDIEIDAQSRQIEAIEGRANDKLSKEDLCNGARYLVTDNNGDTVSTSLSHLCRQGRSSLRFVLIADTQEDHEVHAETADFLVNFLDENTPVDFVINAGDIVDRGSLIHWQAYRANAQTYTSRYPVVPVIGNHEYKDDPNLTNYKKVYGVEANMSYYRLEFAQAALLVLNSNTDLLSRAENAAQDQWLEQNLAELSSAQKPIFVTFHHAPYSSGVASILMPRPPRYIRSNWVPMFEAYGVKMVLNGHEHVYEHLQKNNLHFLVTGPAAGEIGYTKPWRSRYSVTMLRARRTATLIAVGDGGDVSVETYDVEDGALLDAFAL